MRIKTGWVAAITAACLGVGAGNAFAMMAASPHAAKDARIAREVRQKLAQDLPNSSDQVSVATKGNGVVVLSGRTETGIAEATALRDAHQVPGVTAVENHLQIPS